MSENKTSRRQLLKYGVVAGASAIVFGVGGYFAGISSSGGQRTVTQTVIGTTQVTTTPTPTAALPDTVTIAFSGDITTLEPHGINRNIILESPHSAIFDRFIDQGRDLKFVPGVLEEWSWGPDRMSMDIRVRRGVLFHDGTPLTSDDIDFSVKRISRDGMAYAGVFRTIGEIEIKDQYNLRFIFSRYDPSIFVWLGFLNAFVVPKEYVSKVGDEKFGSEPIGSGPYKVRRFQPGRLLELEAFEDHWRGAPPIRRVLIKVVTDPTARSVEVETGTSDFTHDLALTEYFRLVENPSLRGVRGPVTDVAMLFLAPYYKFFSDKKVRLAIHHAIDKESLVKDVLLGFGVPLATLEAPGYLAYSEGYKGIPYDPERAKSLLRDAGYSSDNPLNISIGTTRGFRTRDYEVIQAVAAMLNNVGIRTEITTYTIPEFFDRRSRRGDLPALSLYYWSNSTAEPINSTGFSMWPNSPFSVWAGLKQAGKDDYTGLMQPALEKITPVFTEKDETKRIQLAKEAAIWVVEEGLVIPLYQVVVPYVMKRRLQYEPWPQGFILPQSMRWS